MILGLINSKFYPLSISQGELIAIINYISQMLLSIIVLSNLIIIYTRCFSSGTRILEVLDISPNMNSGHINNISDTNIAIDFENVSFSYSNSKFIKNINLQIKKGEKIGIVGLTASGKSTFLNLINRSYDVTDGILNLFGNNIKDYNLNTLKHIVKYIGQKPSFFSGTIRDNIIMSEDCSELELFSALEKSGSLEFINKLSNNIDFILENNATNLSGGQRQRLSIARAFIGNPKILIFDDVTSSLDFNTEATILKNIYEHSNLYNLTLLISSQKISNVRNCDRIIVFDNGNIENIGTHNELLNNSIIYKKMWTLHNGGM